MSGTTPTLSWTGERMIPLQSDAATELFHWQRYLFFKPWYEDAKVVDAASGEGYGTGFAGVYATRSTGVEIAPDAVAYATERYPHSTFVTSDVCAFDYSDADLVISFETIEHLPDPNAFLKALASCNGRIVISTPNRKTHSPGNSLSDKPLNPFHTIEWTPLEFAELIQEHFQGRTVRFLSQNARYPGSIVEGLDDEAMYCIAVIGEGDLPSWPKLGLAIPTCNNYPQLQETLLTYSRFYPGTVEFAVVANGSNASTMADLNKLAQAIPEILHVIEEPDNTGYGTGCNIGLEFLREKGGFDFYGVSNDDVICMPGTLIELAGALQALQQQGQNPGVIGPVTNKISGHQQVNIGSFQDRHQLLEMASAFHREHHSSASQCHQLRGLLLLITPECLDTVGGFDPRFGWGNFEDDDHNLRCKLAGFTLWTADGSFLYHHGSQTFQGLKIDYAGNLERNRQCFSWKWDLANTEEWPMLDELPSDVSLHVPLGRAPRGEFLVTVPGGERIDLFHQASDIEFVAWVHERLKARHRMIRRDLFRVIMDFVNPEEAVVETEEAETTAA